jgi:hypothetical protein
MKLISGASLVGVMDVMGRLKYHFVVDAGRRVVAEKALAKHPAVKRLAEAIKRVDLEDALSAMESRPPEAEDFL